MVIDVGKNNNQTGEDLNIHLYRHLHDKCILKYPWCRYKMVRFNISSSNQNVCFSSILHLVFCPT